MIRLQIYVATGFALGGVAAVVQLQIAALLIGLLIVMLFGATLYVSDVVFGDDVDVEPLKYVVAVVGLAVIAWPIVPELTQFVVGTVLGLGGLEGLSTLSPKTHLDRFVPAR